MVLVSWTTGSGTNDVGGQGLFWEIAPNAYRNSAAYAGYSSEDGGTIGTVSEQEIRSELLRGAGATSLESCNSP
jgi:hypothetical protein